MTSALSPWDSRNPTRRVDRDPVAKLREVMRERADHAYLVGIPTPERISRRRILIRWRDYLARDSGVLATVPAEDTTVLEGLLNEIAALKAQANKAA